MKKIVSKKKKPIHNADSPYIAYYVATNTQLLNSINLKLNRYQNAKSDLFIDYSNRIDKEFVHQIHSNNIFQEIYLNDTKKISENISSSFINRVHRFYLRLSSQRRELSIIKNTMNSSRQNYTHLVIPGLWSSFLDIAICFIKKNPSIRIILIEDGLGSYVLNINTALHNCSCLTKIVWIIMHHSNMMKDIKTIISKVDETNIYCPSAITFHDSLSIQKLNPLTLENPVRQILVNNINSPHLYLQYIERDIFYILQGWIKEDADFSICSATINTICSIFDPKKIIIKGHPNSKNIPKCYTFPIEKFQNTIYYDVRDFFFESLISHINIEEKILITINSSLVMYPKFMYDKEPFVVFTYKLYPAIYSKNGGSLDYFSTVLKNTYKSSNRVFIPSTIGELYLILKKIQTLKK